MRDMVSESEIRARMDLADREDEIRKELKDVPLSAFRASDLPALAEIQRIKEMHGRFASVEDMELIEKRIETWKETERK